MTNHPNRNGQMSHARKIARRLDAAVTKAVGHPAGNNKTYAYAYKLDNTEPEIIAFYDAGNIEECFSAEDAVRVCEYFEKGGKVRVSVLAYLDRDVSANA